ncbi:MAG: hypothetical protein AB1453_00815 [Chloroflexota bacterium]|jgi:hypothetical protein
MNREQAERQIRAQLSKLRQSDAKAMPDLPARSCSTTRRWMPA